MKDSNGNREVCWMGRGEMGRDEEMKEEEMGHVKLEMTDGTEVGGRPEVTDQ
jgi:hypothetical protein